MMKRLIEFGFAREEVIIILMNCAHETNLDKILKVIDYIEPVGTRIVSEDIDRIIDEKEIIKILFGR